MNLESYKGYEAKVEYDEDEDLFIGKITGIRDVLSFHAESARDIEGAFRSTIDDYLAVCRGD